MEKTAVYLFLFEKKNNEIIKNKKIKIKKTKNTQKSDLRELIKQLRFDSLSTTKKYK